MRFCPYLAAPATMCGSPVPKGILRDPAPIALAGPAAGAERCPLRDAIASGPMESGPGSGGEPKGPVRMRILRDGIRGAGRMSPEAHRQSSLHPSKAPRISGATQTYDRQVAPRLVAPTGALGQIAGAKPDAPPRLSPLVCRGGLRGPHRNCVPQRIEDFHGVRVFRL